MIPYIFPRPFGVASYLCNACLNYTEKSLILVSDITGCVSISAFASLLSISIGITSCSVALKIFAIAAGIKSCKLKIKEKKKEHDKTVLLTKARLNSKEVLINHETFVLINNLLNEYNIMMEQIKKLKT